MDCKCGNKIKSDDKYCNQCGSPVNGTKKKLPIIPIVLIILVLFESIALVFYLITINGKKLEVSGQEFISGYTYNDVKYKQTFKFDKTNKFEYYTINSDIDTEPTKIEGKYFVVDNKIIIEYVEEDETVSSVLFINKDYICASYKECDETSRYYNSKDSRSNLYPKFGTDNDYDNEDLDDDNSYLENKPEYVNVSEPTIYIFHGDGCPHCADLLEWIKDYKYKKSYKVVKYEVWNDANNSKLMIRVGNYLNKDANGVPFIVIGDQVIEGFSKSTTPDEMTKALDKAYENIGKNKYYDVIETVKK